MITRRLFLSGMIAAPTIVSSSNLFAQSYPARPIRLIVPYAAGGGTDAIARVVAQTMGQNLGQTVVVENIATAGGNIATQTAASAAPDGYTILMANQGPMAVNPHLFKSLKVDTLKAFEPITLIAAAPLVAVVPQKSEFKTIRQLVDFARANPGKLTYGSAGNGSASHLAALLLNVIAGIDTVHVPYRGAGPAIGDLLGGQTQFMITTIPSVSGLIENGQMRALAVTSKERAPTLAEVPSIAESGWPAYEASAWYGFVAPKGTPDELIARLHKATIEAINDTAVRSRLANEGAKPVGNSPAEFGAFIKSEHRRWAEIVSTAKLAIN
ncbi:MAG: Bug family tripartite tricarboxylate transporter substrate binding protein [Pseudomonadota bacterium]